MLEPGRSLVADACVLVSRVLGAKSNGGKFPSIHSHRILQFIYIFSHPPPPPAPPPTPLPGKQFLVVTAAMTELIRPALYSAYHHIAYASPPTAAATATYEVVGPVCESGDFLGKDRVLHVPDDESRVVVFDVGAYGFSMSSNYNMRCRAAE